MKNKNWLDSKEALNAKFEADMEMKKDNNYAIRTPKDFENWAKNVAKSNRQKFRMESDKRE